MSARLVIARETRRRTWPCCECAGRVTTPLQSVVALLLLAGFDLQPDHELLLVIAHEDRYRQLVGDRRVPYSSSDGSSQMIRNSPCCSITSRGLP